MVESQKSAISAMAPPSYKLTMMVC